MVKNEYGHIAVKRTLQNPKRIRVNGRYYWFEPRNNICLAWVRQEDLQSVLAIKRRCCNGMSPKQQFFVATETDVRRYTYGGR